jgi:hypothetical protein
LKSDGGLVEGAEEGRGTATALFGDALYSRCTGNDGVRLTHPTIVGPTHLLIPRRMPHVSEGRAQGFVSDTGTIFRARLHLGRYGRKRLTPKTRLPKARERLKLISHITTLTWPVVLMGTEAPASESLPS